MTQVQPAPVITWKTHRVAGGWMVYSFGYHLPAIKTGVARNRAIATQLARQWCAYLRAPARRAVA